MLISYISRQCVIKLKEYSDKKNNLQRTRLPSSTNNTGGDAGADVSSATPLVDIVTPSTASNRDRSLLGQLLNCKPCRQIINRERDKKVRSSGSGKKTSYLLYIRIVFR